MAASPFPGLRPFRTEDRDFFFGQDRNITDLFQRIGRNRFVAVLGESGCGKSSLVYAGLIPLLLPDPPAESYRWRVVSTHPGMSPVANLVSAIAKAGILEASMAEIDQTVRADSNGLVEALRPVATKNPRRNLLLVVDQFEELFRFRREAPDRATRENESAFFVKLLLAAAQSQDAEIFVVLTMRSEYLGDCSQFYQLAETISNGLFLLPRMTRIQCEQAILGPARKIDLTIPAQLTQRLLNESEEREDGLPLLQHGLRWLYDNRGGSEATRLELPDSYREFENEKQKREKKDGKESKDDFLSWCLNSHLNSVLGGLSKEGQGVAKGIFKLLGDRDSRARLVRRPTEWWELKGVHKDPNLVLTVLDAFRDESLGNTFLRPSKQERPGKPDRQENQGPQLQGDAKVLQDDDKIDLCHEVMLRRWGTYATWLGEETENAATYMRLADAADRHFRGEDSLLSGLGLEAFLNWRAQVNPQENWARRYFGLEDKALKRPARSYKSTIDFLEMSAAEAKRQTKKDKRRRSLLAGAVSLALVFAAMYAYNRYTIHREMQEMQQEELRRKIESVNEKAAQLTAHSDDLQTRIVMLETERKQMEQTIGTLREAKGDEAKNATLRANAAIEANRDMFLEICKAKDGWFAEGYSIQFREHGLNSNGRSLSHDQKFVPSQAMLGTENCPVPMQFYKRITEIRNK